MVLALRVKGRPNIRRLQFTRYAYFRRRIPHHRSLQEMCPHSRVLSPRYRNARVVVLDSLLIALLVPWLCRRLLVR